MEEIPTRSELQELGGFHGGVTTEIRSLLVYLAHILVDFGGDFWKYPVENSNVCEIKSALFKCLMGMHWIELFASKSSRDVPLIVRNLVSAVFR